MTLWLRPDSRRPSNPASVVPVSTTVDHTGLADKPADDEAETSVGTEGNGCGQLQNVESYQ